VRFGMIGLDLECAAVTGDRLIDSPGLERSAPQVAVCFHIVGLDRQRLSVALQCPLHLAQTPIGIAQIVMRFGECRVKLECAQTTVQRLIRFAEREQRVTEIVVCLRVFRPKLQRPALARERFMVSIEGQQGITEIAVSLGEVGPRLQSVAEAGHGFFHATGRLQSVT
jgi:hypothetical protein